MMVVAVIGILLAILVPRVTGIKDDAKMVALETNVRTVEVVAHQLIDDYNTADKVEKEIINKLYNDYGDIKNPFNNTTGIGVWTGSELNKVKVSDGNIDWASDTDVEEDGDIDGAAVVFKEGTGDEADNPSSEEEKLRGCIFISAYNDDGKIVVDIIPYDKTGKQIEGKTVTVEQ
ncbi:MAG: type II secretion system protein [Desulfotomaculum sp.]|nr:type II secretion system protein [Desulfotomaculum sp.]